MRTVKITPRDRSALTASQDLPPPVPCISTQADIVRCRLKQLDRQKRQSSRTLTTAKALATNCLKTTLAIGRMVAARLRTTDDNSVPAIVGVHQLTVRRSPKQNEYYPISPDMIHARGTLMECMTCSSVDALVITAFSRQIIMVYLLSSRQVRHVSDS